MKTTSEHFPGFAYSVKELYQYIAVADLFTIILDNGDIIKFTPNRPEEFEQWLLDNGIGNIRKQPGWVIE